MTQKSLDFGPRERINRDTEKLRTILRRVADVVGVKEIAYEADVSPSYVVQALNGGKSLKPEIVFAGRELAPEELAMELRRVFAGEGYHVSGERPLTPEEKLARLESRLRSKFGELGEEAMKEAYRD